MLRLIFISISISVLLPVQLAYGLPIYDTFEIKGQVIDAETGLPLPGVNLFLDQTQKGTATDRNGNFEIRNIVPGNYTLVISMVGYEIEHQSISIPFSESQPLFISLTPIVTELPEIVVKAEKSGRWLRNLKRFEEAFMGITENASRTEITNSEILDFDRKGGMLIATTKNNPLVLINKSLGYKIEFYIEKIEIKGERIGTDGFAKYEELVPVDRNEYSQWQIKREAAFKGSFRHFVTALSKNEVEKEGFVVFYTNFENDLFNREILERYIKFKKMKDRLTEFSQIWTSTSIPNQIALVNGHSDYIGVIYTKNSVEDGIKEYVNSDIDLQVSLIELPADTALVDIRTGNFVYPYRPVLHGYWGITSRLPDLLPNDFDSAFLEKETISPVSDSPDTETDNILLKISRGNLLENATAWLDEGLKLKQKGKNEQALAAWAKAMEVLPEGSYVIAREYVKLVAEQQMKKYYDRATVIYYRSLIDAPKREMDRQEFEKDVQVLKLLMKTEEFEERFGNREEHELPRAIRLFWESADPLPTSPSNPRLIEHYARISVAIAQFPDENSPLGFDDRGKTWVRYGEPDKKLDTDLHLNRGEIHNFVSDFFSLVDNSGVPCQFSLTANIMNRSNIESDISSVKSTPIVNYIENEINSKSFLNNIDIWIYKPQELENNSLVYYFMSDQDNTFNQIDSIDEMFSPSLFIWSGSKCAIGNLTSGLAIQYMTYQKLIGFDSYFISAFNKIDTDIFSQAVRASDYAVRNLATKLKSENKLQALKNQSVAPPESSAEEEKIPSIPLEIYQYRLLDEQEAPVLATFVESRPASAFLSDLTASQDQLFPDKDDNNDIFNELSRWYTLRQGADLRDAQGRLAGRLRSLPELPLDEEDRVPATSLFTIPHLPEPTRQHFYVTLENIHPETEPAEESVFPDELRGLGRLAVAQPELLDLSGEGPVPGDLLIGYGRMEHTESHVKFPFVVSHERTIPEGENLVVHFEAYRLQTDGQGFANFEVNYEIEPKQGLFGRLLANKDELSGTLIFGPRAGRFAESLEFEELSLEPGSYRLHWRVRDVIGERETIETVEFEVTENK